MATPAPLIGTLLDDAVALHPERTVLRIDDHHISYGELDAMVGAGVSRLQHHGVGHGSKVALSASNSVEFVAAVFAIARLGAVTVMVSTSWREAEAHHAYTLCEPTHTITDASGATDLHTVAGGQPVLMISELFADPPRPPGLPGLPGPTTEHATTVELDDLAVMVFSSGTTGLPKAVRHSHRTLSAGTDHWVQSLGLTSKDRLQISTPPFHILGLLNLLAVVRAGASVRLHRRFDLDALLTAIQVDRVTIEMAVAPIAMAIAAHPELERFDLSSLRYIMWGATPVTASIANTVTARTGVRFLPAYGASELPVLSANPVDRPESWRLDSVGVAPLGVEVRAVDLETGVELAAGETGQLQGRSDSMMVGYLPESANAEAFADGWYCTGDVGTVDANGWVTITDRVKEMVKVNGFQVAPAEIENVLLGHSGVADCAVFGVPDERTGEGIIAAVVRAPHGTVTTDELMALVSNGLSSYKRIREVYFVDSVPRLPSGKVLRRQLKADYLN